MSNKSTYRPSSARGDILTSFDQTSVRCLTREEECLLQTATAMVIVKERFRQRQMQRIMRRNAQENNDSNDDPTLQLRHSRLDSIFARNVRPMTALPRKLLQRSQPRDHLDHLFQVASRLAGTIESYTQEDVEASSALLLATNKRTLSGLACHLVQQLDSWIDSLLTSPQEGKASRPVSVAGRLSPRNDISPESSSPKKRFNDPTDGSEDSTWHAPSACADLEAVETWMSDSLLSHPHAATVHRAMALHATMSRNDDDHDDFTIRNAMLNSWWHVTSDLLAQVYHGSIATPPTHVSCDALAVALLYLLHTIASASESIIIPDCLGELVMPLPTPTNLPYLHWTLTDTSMVSLVEGPPEFSLNAGAKLMVRLGLYRILLLHPGSQQRNEMSFEYSFQGF